MTCTQCGLVIEKDKSGICPGCSKNCKESLAIKPWLFCPGCGQDAELINHRFCEGDGMEI